MALERAYLAALTKVSSFALDGDRLELSLAGGGKIWFGAAPG
jgi:heat shock protein HslJ